MKTAAARELVRKGLAGVSEPPESGYKKSNIAATPQAKAVSMLRMP